MGGDKYDQILLYETLKDLIKNNRAKSFLSGSLYRVMTLRSFLKAVAVSPKEVLNQTN